MSLGMRICISSLIFSLLQLIKILLLMFNHSVVSNSLWPHGLQHARLPCPSPTPGSCTNSCPWSQWCHPTISPSVAPSTPAFSLSQDQGLIKWVRSSHKVAKVLELQLQHQFFQWIFSINFLVLCLHSFPASESFQTSQLFTSDGQSIGVSTSASVLPMNIQDWFPLGLTSLITL